jgi:outer membrane protein TolC
LPIELMNSLRLLCESRLAYLDAIMDYNQAQMELYVALGQPPANTLARPVPPGAPAPVTK